MHSHHQGDTPERDVQGTTVPMSTLPACCRRTAKPHASPSCCLWDSSGISMVHRAGRREHHAQTAQQVTNTVMLVISCHTVRTTPLLASKRPSQRALHQALLRHWQKPLDHCICKYRQGLTKPQQTTTHAAPRPAANGPWCASSSSSRFRHHDEPSSRLCHQPHSLLKAPP